MNSKVVIILENLLLIFLKTNCEAATDDTWRLGSRATPDAETILEKPPDEKDDIFINGSRKQFEL